MECVLDQKWLTVTVHLCRAPEILCILTYVVERA